MNDEVFLKDNQKKNLDSITLDRTIEEEPFLFYRRKFYIVKNEFVEVFNAHFITTNLPNQQKHGARLIGRWMKENDDHTTEVFAIWEYDSYETYKEIESNIRNDKAHVKRVQDWYQRHGGKENVFREYIVEVRNEEIKSTVE